MTAANRDTIERMVGEFNSTHPDIQVEAAFQGSYNDNVAKYFTALRGGDLPDIIQVEDTSVQRMVDSGTVARAQDCIDAEGYDLSDHLDRVIAYYSIGERQEDLFIGSPDGPIRRVTDDAARDRAPVFTPDGRSLLFYSNRDGQWAPWIVGVDGGGLRKITNPPAGAVYIFVSPAGDRVVFAADSARSVYSAPLASTLTQSTELPGTIVGDKYFSPTSWSPDGARLAGILSSASGRTAGAAIYDFAARTATMIEEEETYAAKWLADNRRIVYFAKDGRELVILDTVTRKRTVVDVRLPGPGTTEMFAVSPDNRTIYYGAARAEADIWIVERK
jgi:dipeptidyl aminopeptidase/acylaminoacyl peptidase